MLKYSVLGAGAGGASMAVILKSQGYPVKLYDKNSALIEQLNALPAITLTGKYDLAEKPDLITDDIHQVIADADVIMVCTTTDAHHTLAEQMAPKLHDEQLIVLNPGHTGGAMEVRNIFSKCGMHKHVYVAESTDLIYSCRPTAPGVIFHSGIKKAMKLAALPASDTAHVLDVIGSAFPVFYAGGSVLETSLENLGALLHPMPTVMNINKLDNHIPWDYYMEGITPSIARMVEQMDAEKKAIAAALGLEILSLTDSIKRSFKIDQDGLYNVLQHNAAYKGVKSPPQVQHRFVTEDTLSGTVPIAAFGRVLGIATPMTDAAIALASAACGRDFMAEGRTAERLGIAGKTADEIRRMVL